MKKRVSDLSEREVQKLIADYPWLLNIDYEKIWSLKKREWNIFCLITRERI